MEPKTWRDETLVLNDGVKLQSRIWQPQNSGPWPALLMRQPYGREIASTITYNHPSWWASHGYLVVIQDVRGQGGSDGDFTGFSQEALDTTQTHNWVRSLPECNGLLGTYGFSYQGLTQLLAEPNTPPPECIAPAMTGLDECEHWSCDGGAFWWHLGISWGLQLAALKAKRDKDGKGWNEIRCSLEDGSYLRKGPSLLKRFDPDGMALNWLNQSHKSNKNWTTYKPLESWLKQPILLIGGWWDPHLRGVIDLYKRSIDSGGKPEIHIGPATHLQWWDETQLILLEFFNKHLQSTKPQVDQIHKPKLWNLTKKKWQSSTDSTKSVNNWGLISQGSACLDSKDGILELNQKGQGFLNLVHDPWRPVPSIGGHLAPEPGLADRKSIDIRSDVAVFTSPKLEKDFHLEGIPNLNLLVEADQPGFDLCVALSITNQNESKVLQISTGFLRIFGPQAQKCVLRKVVLQPILVDLSKGERLRISIAGSSWPAIGINPGNQEYACGCNNLHCKVITISLNLSNSNFHVLPLLS